MYKKSKNTENKEKFTRVCSIASTYCWLDRFQQSKPQQDNSQHAISIRKHRKKLSDPAEIKKNIMNSSDFLYENFSKIDDSRGISRIGIDSKRTKKPAFEKNDEIFIMNTVFGSPIKFELNFSDRVPVAEAIFDSHSNHTGFNTNKALSF